MNQEGRNFIARTFAYGQRKTVGSRVDLNRNWCARARAGEHVLPLPRCTALLALLCCAVLCCACSCSDAAAVHVLPAPAAG